MRVVHFAPAVLPYQTPIYNEIAKRVDLHVVYLREPQGRHRSQLWTAYDDQWGVEPKYPYRYAEARSFGIDALDLLVAAPRRLGVILDELDPGVISVTSWALASISSLLWSRRRGIAAVMWSESGKTSGLLRDPLSNAYRRLMLRGCDAYLTVGRAARDYAVQLGAAQDYCVEALLPSAVYIDEVKRPVPTEKEDSLRILWVGRLVRRKRPELAIEVFGQIAHQFDRARLTIVGSGPLEANVRSAATRVGGRIDLVGQVEGESLAAIYRSHDVLLVTAVREVWGLVVNEALAHGLYVIASDEVGAAMNLLEVDTGQVVPADDGEAFADALRRFAAIRQSRPAVRPTRGRVTTCTPEAFASKYVEALALAVSRRPTVAGNRVAGKS